MKSIRSSSMGDLATQQQQSVPVTNQSEELLPANSPPITPPSGSQASVGTGAPHSGPKRYPSILIGRSHASPTSPLALSISTLGNGGESTATVDSSAGGDSGSRSSRISLSGRLGRSGSQRPASIMTTSTPNSAEQTEQIPHSRERRRSYFWSMGGSSSSNHSSSSATSNTSCHAIHPVGSVTNSGINLHGSQSRDSKIKSSFMDYFQSSVDKSSPSLASPATKNQAMTSANSIATVSTNSTTGADNDTDLSHSTMSLRASLQQLAQDPYEGAASSFDSKRSSMISRATTSNAPCAAESTINSPFSGSFSMNDKFGTIRRSKIFSSSSTSSSIYSTINRNSHRMKGTGADSSVSPTSDDSMSMFSYTVETEPGSAIDNDDVEADEADLSGLANERFLKVFLSSSSIPIPIRIPNDSSVEDLVLLVTQVADQFPETYPSFGDNHHAWQIGKIERSMLNTRLWMGHDRPLSHFKLNDGDELRMKNITEKDVINYLIPPSKQVYTLEFTFDETVKNALDRLQIDHSLDASISYGLYLKRIGVWLDEKRTLMSYEIEAEHLLELRAISQEFLLRIVLPDFDTKFAVKALPSLTAGDVISLVQNNLSSRKIKLDDFRRGSADPFESPFAGKSEAATDRKLTHYALYIQATNTWMREDRTLEEYQASKITENIQFRVQYQPISIGLPGDMLTKRGADVFMTINEKGDRDQTRYIQFFTSETMKVSDVVQMLNMENSHYDADVAVCSAWGKADEKMKSSPFGLYTRGGERLNDADLIWSAVKEASTYELYEYRLAPCKVLISSYLDNDLKLAVDVDLSRKVGELLPFFWRRLGIGFSVEFKTCRIAGNNMSLNANVPLIRQGIKPNSLIILETIKSSSRSVPTASDDNNVNIWDEPTDNPGNISYSSDADQLVTAASLNKLVEKLTAGDSGGESSQYLDLMKTFLMTYQSFCTPTTFLQKLIERYHVPRRKDIVLTFADFDKQRLKIQLRVINVLQQWTKKYAYDFVDLKSNEKSFYETNMTDTEREKRLGQSQAKYLLIMQVQDFAENTIVLDHPSLGRQLRKYLLRLRDGTHVQLITKHAASNSPPSKFIRPAVGPDGESRLSIFICDPEEVARQLTLMEFELFSKIMPHEFLNQAWTKPDAEIRTPNINSLTKRFNLIALWVVKSILEVKTVRARAKRVAKLIEISAYLYSLNNFSTLMAFIAAFNKAPITRLKHTMKEIPGKASKKLCHLEKIMSAESSYKNYRTKIHSVNPPCIPYIGVYLLDLTYMEDGNPNKIGNLINFAKRRLIYNLIREVQQYQDQEFDLKLVEEIQSCLHKALSINVKLDQNVVDPKSACDGPAATSLKDYEDQLFQLSLQREPRGAERNSIQ